MKTTSCSLVALLLGLCLTSLASPGTVSVVGMKNARTSSDAKTWSAAKAGTISQGVIVETASTKGSYAQVAFGPIKVEGAKPTMVPYIPSSTPYPPVVTTSTVEADTVKLTEDTILVVDGYSETDTGAGKVTDTQLSLRNGRIAGNVKRLIPGSRYEVKFKSGVAGVRTGVYDLSADGHLRVLAGNVVIAVTKPDGTVMTKAVSGGEQFNPVTGDVSPMTPADIAALQEERSDVIRVLAEDRTTHAPDRTVRPVSPIHGHDRKG